MQSKVLVFLIPFLGLAAATHLANFESGAAHQPIDSSTTLSSVTNQTNYNCDECLSFLGQLKSTETINEKLMDICYSVLPRFIFARKAICQTLIEDISARLRKLDVSANCYAIGVCPLPTKPEDEPVQKWDEADSCYFCAGVVTVAGNNLAARFPEYASKNYAHMIQALAWRYAGELLRELKLDSEIEPVAASKYLDAFAKTEMSAKHSLAYCYSINKCKQFPFHM